MTTTGNPPCWQHALISVSLRCQPAVLGDPVLSLPMLVGTVPLHPSDVLVVDPFDGALCLVSRDGREVAQAIVNREPPRGPRRLCSLSLREEKADDFTDKILSGSPGARAVLLVLEHQGEHNSQWSAITSVASKLGCTAQTLRNWVR